MAGWQAAKGFCDFDAIAKMLRWLRQEVEVKSHKMLRKTANQMTWRSIER
jgi:hypothetical protein